MSKRNTTLPSPGSSTNSSVHNANPAPLAVGGDASTPLTNWAQVIRNGAPTADLSLAARRTLNQIRTEWLQRTHTVRGTHGFSWLARYVEIDLGFQVHTISRSSHRTIAIVGTGSETESFIAPARALDAARCSVDASAAFVTLATLVPRSHRSPEHVWHQVRALQKHFTLSAHQAARNPDAEFDDNGGRVSLLALAAAVLCGIGAHCLSLEECTRLLAEELEYLVALSVTCNGPDRQQYRQFTRRNGLEEYTAKFYEWTAAANAATQQTFNRANTSMNSDSGILDMMVRADGNTAPLAGTSALLAGAWTNGNATTTATVGGGAAASYSRNSGAVGGSSVGSPNTRRRRSSIFPADSGAGSGAGAALMSPDQHPQRPLSSSTTGVGHSPAPTHHPLAATTTTHSYAGASHHHHHHASSSASTAAPAPIDISVDWRRVQWTSVRSLPRCGGQGPYPAVEMSGKDFIAPPLTYVLSTATPGSGGVLAVSNGPDSARVVPGGVTTVLAPSSAPPSGSPSQSPARHSSSGDLVTPRTNSMHGLPSSQQGFESMITAALTSGLPSSNPNNNNSGNASSGVLSSPDNQLSRSLADANRSLSPAEWRDAVTRSATCVMMPAMASTYLVKNYVRHLGFDAKYRFKSAIAALTALAKDYDCGRIGSDSITPWSGPREYSLAISSRLRLSLQLPLDRHCVLPAPFGTAQLQPAASHGLDDKSSARTGTARTDGTEVHGRVGPSAGPGARGLTRMNTGYSLGEGSIDPDMASSWEGSFGPGGRSGMGLGVGSISLQDKGETDNGDGDTESNYYYDQDTKTVPRPDRGSAYTRRTRGGDATVAAGVDAVAPSGACCGGGCLVM